MLSRRLIPRLSTVKPSSSLTRPFTSTSTSLSARAPALADIEPDKGHEFDARQAQFRADVEAAQRKRDEEESQSVSASEGESSGILGSLSTSGAARAKDDENSKKGTGRLSNLIYGTKEGREMDREIERSFSQVLARGKYVHSIVFHEVKPDKVDEYVELVGSWYPRMASMPENKVHLVGSWRTEVGDCDTFGA